LLAVLQTLTHQQPQEERMDDTTDSTVTEMVDERVTELHRETIYFKVNLQMYFILNFKLN